MVGMCECVHNVRHNVSVSVSPRGGVNECAPANTCFVDLHDRLGVESVGAAIPFIPRIIGTYKLLYYGTNQNRLY